MDAPTIQDILREHYPAYERTHRVQDTVREAVHCMLSCRTAALGGHKQLCPDGHVTRIWYNSCKYRACPRCAFLQKVRWLAEQQARLLGCDHYHAIFTIPHDLNDLRQFNVRLMANLLFRTVRKLLLDMLADPRYLGARPGIIMALHTWGQTLVPHPHIYCLITGGGPVRGALEGGGQWLSAAGRVADGAIPRALHEGPAPGPGQEETAPTSRKKPG